MRLSHVHALFMARRKLTAALADTLTSPSIHEAVNAHAGAPTRQREAELMVGLLRSAERVSGPPGVLASLQRMAHGSATYGRRTRRAANAVKWLQRIENERARAWCAGRAGLTGEALRAYGLAPPCPAEPAHSRFRPSQFAHWGNCQAAAERGSISDGEISRCETHENSGDPINRQMAFYSSLVRETSEATKARIKTYITKPR